MNACQISPEITTLVSDFNLPETLGFGTVKAPIMYRADFFDGQWQTRQLLPYGNIELDPASKVLHYAQEVFEGQKAYRVGSQRRANFFRPMENHKRLNRSAERMCMQTVPESIYAEGIGLVTAHCEPLIPQSSGESLYLRPFLIGTRANLGMAVSDSYIFMVIASPSAIYHSGQMRVQIERQNCRAARGGTGAAKTGGNYAAALLSASQVQSRGYDQSLWLDPIEMRYIEELSGMNLFALIDGKLHTPRLNGSFLPGITRDSVVTLARHLGYEVIERDMAINDLLADIESGNCNEVFACGTAAIISPVSLIADADDRPYEPKQTDVVASELRQALLAIQEGRAEDPFGWVQSVDAQYYP